MLEQSKAGYFVGRRPTPRHSSGKSQEFAALFIYQALVSRLYET